MAVGELHQSALALLRQGNLNAAELAYAEVLKERPDDFLALHRLGCIAMQAGRHGEACGLFQRAVVTASKVLATRFSSAATRFWPKLGERG
jgi:Flp pilus assembly protein TadD